MAISLHSDGGAPPESRTLDYDEFASLSIELIERNGGLRFRAHGQSMRPAIHSGDLLTVEKADPDTLRIGDIVMSRTDVNAILVHRVIKRDGDRWTTCGDALQTPDVQIAADQLLGIVRKIERHGKEKRLSQTLGRAMAAISRHSTTMPGRIIKRFLRLF